MKGSRQDILDWAEQGRIAAPNVVAALRVVGTLPDPADWRRFVDRLLLWGGATLCAAGLIFFLAYNWQDLGKFAKFGLAEALLAVSVVVSFRGGGESPASKAALFAAALVTGALFALFGQTYQTGADTFELFAAWALAILPWALVSRSPLLWLLCLALGNLAIYYYFHADLSVIGFLLNFERQFWALIFFNAAALAIWEYAAGKFQPRLHASWAMRIIAAACGLSVTWFCMMTILSSARSTTPLVYLTYLAWLVISFVYYRYKRFDLFIISGQILSLVLIVATFMVDALFKMSIIDDAFGSLVIGAVVICLSAAGGVWLKHLAKIGGKV